MKASETASSTINRQTGINGRKRIVLIGLVMATVAVSGVFLSVWNLYRVSFEKQRGYLINLAQSNAKMIEAVTRLNILNSRRNDKNSTFATINKIIKTVKSPYGFDSTVDILLGRAGGSRSIKRRYDESMRRAVSGQSGAIIEVDSSGVGVLAAYAPVNVLNLGVVARVDMDEIRAPFIENGIIIGGGVLLLLMVGGVLIWTIGCSMTKDLERTADNLGQVRLQLIQSSKLATLGEMSSGIAHELNQPLSIIGMVADSSLMSLRNGSMDKEIIEKKLTTIATQSERMASIINHMQVFSRKDSSDCEPFVVCNAVYSAVEMIEQQLRADGIKIDVAISGAEHCMVMGHSVQLEQVLLNMLANAHDAIRNRMESTSDILVPSIGVSMKEIRDDHAVLISISNNGGNIPKLIMDNIFEPFFTTKERGRGTGLGLSISDRIIVGMNGHIEVDNIADGSRFNIIIPTISPNHDPNNILSTCLRGRRMESYNRAAAG